MDASNVIVWFLGIVMVLTVALVGVITLRHLPIPESLDHIAVGAVGALAGAMAVGKSRGRE